MEPRDAYREFDDSLRDIAELWIEMVDEFRKISLPVSVQLNHAKTDRSYRGTSECREIDPLFNRITKSYAAIIEDIPGVTRDRNYLDAEWDDKHFIVVDTGGFYPDPADDIFLQIKEQALFAIDEADVIIHLLDGKDGLIPSDMEIARLLRASGKKVLWAVNKIHGPTREERLFDFYPLGSEDLLPVSAVTGFGYDDAGAAATMGPDTDFRISLINAPGERTYPVASFTWLLVRRDYGQVAAKAEALIEFIWWALTQGQASAEALGYAPLPQAIMPMVEARLKEVAAGGAAVWSGASTD